MTPAILGIDGGCPGGAVQLAPDGSLLWAAFWDETKDGERIVLRVVAEQHAAPHAWVVETHSFLPMASMVGAVLLDQALRLGPVKHADRWLRPSTVIAVEGVFVGKDKAGALDLKGTAQAQVGHLEVRARSRARWLLATVWRGEVLNLPVRTASKKAKEASQTRIPKLIPGFEDALAALDLGNATHHVTDAGGVAFCQRLRMLKQRRVA
ncbi:MAG: hypothetical protein ACI8RZ_007860 [Myxococcota bacterium]|jgi:hypothetical protein